MPPMKRARPRRVREPQYVAANVVPQPLPFVTLPISASSAPPVPLTATPEGTGLGSKSTFAQVLGDCHHLSQRPRSSRRIGSKLRRSSGGSVKDLRLF